MNKEEIGTILKELRNSSGMTQKEVAEVIGRKQQVIGHWETGYSQPDANTLFTLCEIYNTTVDEAFGFKKKDFFISKSDLELLKKYRDLDAFGQETVSYVLDREIKRLEQLRYSAQVDAVEQERTKEAQNSRLIKYFRGGVAAGSGIYQFEEVMDNLEIPITELTERADFIVDVSGDSMEPLLQNNDKVLVSNEHVGIEDVGVFVKNGQAFVKKRGENSLLSLNSQREDIIVAESDDVVCYGKVIGRVNFDYLDDDKMGKFAIQSLVDLVEMNDVKNQLDDIFQSKIGEKTKRNA